MRGQSGSKLVVLKLGQGNWQQGFPTVIAQVVTADPTQSGSPIVPTQLSGGLPAAPELAAQYRQWRELYGILSQRRSLRRIEIESEGVTHASPLAFTELTTQLKLSLDRWLESDSFRKVERRLRTYLSTTDEIRLIIETADPWLRRFPWQLWSFLEDYPFAEIGLSSPEYGQVSRSSRVAGKVRILAVLGNSQGIDVAHDQALLATLPDAEPVFLVEPTRVELDRHLWQSQGWDILFFAGHSVSSADASQGELAINPQEKLSIAQLKHALNAAIQRGLQIAILNSCDGLGLARAMADLNIPQLIVMREPVPDRVAQTFLQNFLAGFASGQSFYRAVRQAREQLQGLETDFPGATLLPVICQNPAEVSIDWSGLVGKAENNPINNPVNDISYITGTTHQIVSSSNPNQSRFITLKQALLIGLTITGSILGMRWLGGWESLELAAYDQMMRWRPAEVADSRILVVEVTQDDTNQYGYPLEDKTLAQAIEQIANLGPRAIGVDMHRYQPRGGGRSELIRQFQQHENLLTVCWSASTDQNFAPPPEFSETQRLNQVGFSDLLLDGGRNVSLVNPDRAQTDPAQTDPAPSEASGGIVRRQILSYDPKVAHSPPDCATPYSFSFQLAFQFLYEAGIQPLTVNAAGNWQFGAVAFEKLPSRFGGYQSLDGLSSQIMLNYRQALPGQRVTLNQVLQGQVGRNFVEDRIVLIGTTAPIARDYFQTPFGQQAGIWIHAHQVSHLLSTVLNDRPQIWALPIWADALWILGWISAGIGIGYGLRSTTQQWIGGFVLLFLLYQLCWQAFLRGGWLPLIPAAGGLAGTIGAIQIVRKTQFPQQFRSISRSRSTIERFNKS
ncbi:MAG: CHASE2 domain-containing protein [Elainella sp. Prado103]|jgi:CHASE2 domain-containing sensor protein|nr:CHASE2 domain-containing protein [Elainella sp. Prado103]